MIWMDVDTALPEVPVNICPLTDDGDFKTIESSVAYNASGMALYWHFVTTAGVYTVTQVTPTTSGTYDWAHQSQGMYSIEIPASGGASINNDTEGFGWFTGVAAGVLPWRGPTIGFRAAALNDALIDGGDNLDVNVAQWLGTAPATPTVAGVPEVDVTHVSGSAEDIATETKQNTSQSDLDILTGTDGATLATSQPNYAPATSAQATAIETDTQDLQTQIGTAGAGLTGIPKMGYKLASDGLDSVSATIPSAVATTFPDMIKQVWARFFYKSTLSSTELITYASDGTTVVTTQTVSDTGTLQTQGKAS